MNTHLLSRCAAFFLLTSLLLQAIAQQKELRVVVSSPRGVIRSIDQSQTIFATFSEPMVALQAVPKDEGTGPMVIEPKIAGKYRWMGTVTLSFIPEKLLPYSTEFKVKIPAGTMSQNGTTLTSEYSWTFETPRPQVMWTSPGNKEGHADTNTAILIRFNQPVDAQVMAKYTSIKLEKGGMTTYPQFTARQAIVADSIKHPEQVVILKTKDAFGLDAHVVVTVREGVCGTEGPLPMRSPYEFWFSTFGELRFLGILARQNIYPQTGITLLFSNEVAPRDLLKLLSFSPSMKTRAEYYENTYPSQEVYIPLPLLPDSDYVGFIKAGLRDRYGMVLKSDEKFPFHVQSYLPFIRTRTGIGVLEGYESHKFPVTTMNVDSFRIQMGAVNPDRIVTLMQKLSWEYYTKLAFEEGILLSPSSLSEEAKEFTRTKTVATHAKRNTVTVLPFDFDTVLGKNGRGIVFVQVDDMNKSKNAYLKTLVQVTNFGITGKFSPDSNLIWVTNLKDASPVGRASVEIRNDSNVVLWKGETDERGLVKTPGWGKIESLAKTRPDDDEDDEWQYYEERRQPQQWVIVKKGNEIAFTSSKWNDGIQPYRFNLEYDWNPQPAKFEGVLFTDRGLYKANERVEIKGITRVRTGGNWEIASSLKTRLVISNSRGEEIYNQEQALSPFGSFAASLSLKPTAPLGYYSMRFEYQTTVKNKVRWKRITSSSFRVEAFRPAEFEVTAKFQKENYIIGDTVVGYLNAKYLFGAPMKNEQIRWRLSASRSSFAPPGFDGYFFDRLDWLSRYQHRYHGKELQRNDTTLDALGSIAVHSIIRVGELQGTISLMLEGDVTSPSRQTLSGRTSVIVHGGEYYIGLKPSSTFVKEDSAMTIDLITATPEGKILANQNLSMKIFNRIWRSVRKAETGGRFAWYSTVSDSLVDSSSITTTSQPVVKSYVPQEPGFYYIEAAGKDARGNSLRTNAYFYASGSGYVPWERTNDDRVDLIANRTNFQPGETASIIVKSPYERAIALISIEREGIIKHYTTTLVGSAPQIDIPILPEFLPNVFVSVVLLQGRTARPTSKSEADVGRPSFKIGYVALSVNPKEKNLNVTVESDKKEYRPGDTVEIKITVKDIDGKPKASEVTLSVADLGVLNLIGYRTPNPFTSFYRERELAVVTTETRMHIIEQRSYDEKGQEVGGDGMSKKEMADLLDAEGIRKEFRASAYWNPAIITDSKGLATARFKLPDNLTSFEIMAVAQTKTSLFGYGENSFAVNKPLLLQPSLPRFVRVGDKFKSGVVVMNYSDKPQTVSLNTRVTGLQWDNNDSTVHVLQPGQAKEVLFSFAADKIGTAKFIFKAKSESNRDGLLWTIPVNAPRLKETVALYESLTDPAVEQRIIPPADVYTDMGEIDFTTASTALVGLSGGISYLFNYPYWCLEQRASAVLPMILAKDLVDAFKFEVLKDKDYRTVVMKFLDELPLFQRSNGGFAYWKNEDDTWCYISAYAMFTLVQAQRNGYSIDKHAFDTGIEYIKRVLRGQESDEFMVSKYYRQYTFALILYTLALHGQPEFGYMENLYKERDDMPLFAKAYLLKALHASKGNTSMQDELVRDLFNNVKISPVYAHFEERSGCWQCFESNTRTTALILQALIETQPENSLVPKIVRWLIDEQRVGRWRTTQENIYVVDALATYVRSYEKDEPNFRAKITMDGRAILNELFKGRSFNVSQSTVPFTQITLGKQYPVNISKDGQGRLYYGIRMNYYPKGETPAKDEGFSVVKVIETLDGSRTDIYTPGSILKVTLTISSNQYRHFVVVDDPVPAGFEVVNTSFETTATNLDEGGPRKRRRNDYTYNHVEKYDDRVLLFADSFSPGAHSYTYLVQALRSGSYQMPATRAEGMYEPEVFGQTASSGVEIK